MKTKPISKANKASLQNRASRRPGVALQPLVLRWGKIEVRLNADESVDEIVASNVSLHLEQMDDGYWWMGISRPNGERMMVNLYTKHRAAIAVNAESEDGRISVGFTKKAQNHAMQPTAGRRTLKFSMTQTLHPAATRALASGG